MKSLLLILILIAPVLAFNQSGDNVFTVKAVNASISLLPQTDILYQDACVKFKIIKSPSTKIDTIIFSNGKYAHNDTVLRLVPTKNGTALLKIYAKLPGKKSTLSFVKEYKVIRGAATRPPNLDGVFNDSAIHQERVVAMGYLHVESLDYDVPDYPVISFEMPVVNNNGTIDTFKTKGNRMTYTMRDRVDNMKEGEVLQFENIRFLDKGDTFTAPPLRVYLRRDKIQKF